MHTPLPWMFWAFPIAFAAHNLEEALWLPQFSRSAGKFHKPVDRFEFVFAVIILTLLAAVITYQFYEAGKQSIPCYLFFAFNFGMFINVFFPHLVATIALRRYCPGLLTGIVLLAPTTLFLLRYGLSNGYFDLPKFVLITIPFAGMVVGSIPVLFAMGKRLQNALGLKRLPPAAP